MSSISFPGEQQASSAHSGHFYSASLDDNSSFQMNPLSSHPPRTPRTSIITSTTHVYGSSTYETKEEADEGVGADEEDDDDGEEKVKVAKGRVRREEVWRDMFLTSYGRDKAFVRS